MTLDQFDLDVLSMEQEQESREERRSLVRDMVNSAAWRHVAHRALQRRMHRLERTLAGSRKDMEETRFLQGQHALLRELTENAAAVLAEE